MIIRIDVAWKRYWKVWEWRKRDRLSLPGKSINTDSDRNWCIGRNSRFLFLSLHFFCWSTSVNPTIKLYFSSFSNYWPCDGKWPPTAVCHWGSWSDRCLFYGSEVSSLSNDANWNHSDAMWCNNTQKPLFIYFMIKNYSTRYSVRLQIQALKAECQNWQLPLHLIRWSAHIMVVSQQNSMTFFSQDICFC